MAAVTDRSIDPAYLAYQYGDTEKLLIRKETHERYSERPNGQFFDWVVDQLDPLPGQLVADIGCGPGTYQSRVASRGARVLGLDLSAGMLLEARRVAADFSHPVAIVRGDAQALPLATSSCDLLLAAQMLYHVPDRELALREMRRVLRPGGRIVLVAGSGDVPRYMRLHRQIVEELGYELGDSGGSRFTLKDTSLVESVFPTAEVRRYENALAFPNAAAFLRFYASGPVDGIRGISLDASHRPKLMAAMEKKLRPIFAEEGVLREPKVYGCFVAERER